MSARTGKRTKSVTLWLSETEQEQIRDNAAWFGMRVNEFIRMAATRPARLVDELPEPPKEWKR